MYSDMPNFAVVSGYTNASWTLKADLVCEYVCRLLNHMQKNGLRQCTPRLDDPDMERLPWVDFSSGYIQRAARQVPQAGRAPALAAAPELRDGPHEPALRLGARQGDGVLEVAS